MLPVRALDPAPIPPADIKRALDRILESETFSRSERMKRFLEFTVSMVLEGRTDELKEYSIGVAAFDKPENFDPRLDPIVRVEAGRLRTKLKEYYEAEGRRDCLQIHFPKRSYVPQFHVRTPEAEREPIHPVSASPSSRPADEGDPPLGQETPLESIAVLPFADLSPNQDMSQFCDGVTEELINLLSRIEGLRVAARTSAMQFKATAGDIRGIGRQLNVHAVLEGSVRKDGQRVRISTQLISVDDGYNLWSDVYNRELGGLIDLQQDIAQSIVQALGLRLVENIPSRSATGDFQAYKLYLQGKDLCWKRDPDSLMGAVRYFQRSIKRDPKYSLAHAGLAAAYAALAWTAALAPEVAWERCRHSAEEALELDPRLALAYNSLGAMRAAFEWAWAGAEEAFHRAIELDPRDAVGHRWYGAYCLMPQGRLAEAEEELIRARSLDPMAPAVYVHLAWLEYYRGRWDAALEIANECLEMENSYANAHSLRGYVHLARGSPKEALEVFAAALELQPHDSLAVGGAGRCHAQLGESKKAQALLEKLKQRSRNHYVAECDIAQIHIGAGRIDTAFEWLERAADRRCVRLGGLKSDPAYAPLRGDARYSALLSRLSLADG